MLYHFIVVSIYVFSLQVLAHSGTVPPTCSTNTDCSQSSASPQGELYCCGKCGNSVCCGNETLQINEVDCPPTGDNNGGINSSATMLGVIIGGMVLSFSGAMVVHALIRKFIQARRKRRNRDGENGMPVNETPRRYQSTSVHVEYEEDLPSYEDIFIYKRVMDHINNRATCPDGVSRNNDSHAKVDENVNCDSKSDSSAPPPPYTISSRLQAQELDGSGNSTETTAVGDVKTSSQPTLASTSFQQDGIPNSSANPPSNASGPSSEVLIVQVIDMLKKLESNDNCDNARHAIKSAKNFLKEVVERGDTPKTHSRSSTACGNVYESYELITATQTPPQQPDQDTTR